MNELEKLQHQVEVLSDVEKTYPHSSIGNIITQIKSRIKHYETDKV